MNAQSYSVSEQNYTNEALACMSDRDKTIYLLHTQSIYSTIAFIKYLLMRFECLNYKLGKIWISNSFTLIYCKIWSMFRLHNLSRHSCSVICTFELNRLLEINFWLTWAIFRCSLLVHFVQVIAQICRRYMDCCLFYVTLCVILNTVSLFFINFVFNDVTTENVHRNVDLFTSCTSVPANIMKTLIVMKDPLMKQQIK